MPKYTKQDMKEKNLIYKLLRVANMSQLIYIQTYLEFMADKQQYVYMYILNTCTLAYINICLYVFITCLFISLFIKFLIILFLFLFVVVAFIYLLLYCFGYYTSYF